MEIGIQIAAGLSAAHEKGIVHRDLKPANVMLTRDGRVKIVDFGLAKLGGPAAIDSEGPTQAAPRGPGTSPGVLLGTVGYLSPEQARGHPADARSDVFALGVVLYEMLTGQPAFRRDTSVEALNAILKEDVPEMTTGSVPIPGSLERIVRRCLEKEPGERFQTARDVAFALEALGQGSDTASGALASGVIATKVERPAWRTLVTGTAVLVPGVALGAGALRLVLPPPPPRIVSYRPVTHALPGSPVTWTTDGERVYFTVLQEGRLQAYQVALGGGEPAPIELPFDHAVVLDSSRRHSALLVKGWDGPRNPGPTYYPLWIVPVPAGSPRRPGPDVHLAAWARTVNPSPTPDVPRARRGTSVRRSTWPTVRARGHGRSGKTRTAGPSLPPGLRTRSVSPSARTTAREVRAPSSSCRATVEAHRGSWGAGREERATGVRTVATSSSAPAGEISGPARPSSAGGTTFLLSGGPVSSGSHAGRRPSSSRSAR